MLQPRSHGNPVLLGMQCVVCVCVCGGGFSLWCFPELNNITKSFSSLERKIKLGPEDQDLDLIQLVQVLVLVLVQLQTKQETVEDESVGPLSWGRQG